MKTTLHIGTTKTGTTSIQTFLGANRAVLRENGILYPAILGETTHNAVPIIVPGFVRSSLQKREKLRNPAKWEAYRDRVTAGLAREVAEAAPAHVIVSSEHIHSRCMTPEHFAALRWLLAPALGGELEVVLYLRPQIEHAISLYSTMLRHGLARTIGDFLETNLGPRKRHYFDFRLLVERWQGAFPEAKLTVRAFNAVKRLPEGSVTDFLRLTGLDALEGRLTRPERRNESMGEWSAELLRLMNSDFAESLPPATKRGLLRWVREDLKGGAVAPDPALARRFQNSFAEGNAWVIRHCLPDHPQALDPDWSRIDSPARQEVTPAQVMQLVAALATRKADAAAESLDSDSDQG